MNSVQKVVLGISGYGGLDELSPRCDYYYDNCKSYAQKMNQIYEYAMNVYDEYLKVEEIRKAISFIEKLEGNEGFFENQNEAYHAWANL